MSEVYHVTQLPLFGQTKVCKSCNPPTEKPVEEFDRNKAQRDGYATQCKVCAHAAHMRRYYKLHPPKECEQLSPEEEAKREQERANSRNWRLANLEYDRARKRASSDAQREEKNAKQNAKYREAVEAYRAANPLPAIPEGHKKCAACEQVKILDDFYRIRANKDGRDYICKECKDRTAGYKHVGKRRNKPSVRDGHKWCYGCESEQPHSNFLKDKRRHDGYNPRCNDCRSKQKKQFWQENRERLLPENRERLRNLYESNIEYYRAYNRQKNKQPRYRLKFSSMLSNRHAQMRATIVEEVDFRRIIERDGFHCYICDRAIDSAIIDGPARLTFDHVIPLQPRPSEPQGTHTEDNIKPAHRACNQRKGNRPFEDMTPHQRRGPGV